MFRGLTLLFAAVSLFIACNDDETEVRPRALEVPALAEGEVTQTSVEVVWEKIENASFYEWSFDDKTTRTTTCSFVTEGLEPATTYTFEVRACPAEDDRAYLASEWKSISVVTDERTVLPEMLTISVLYVSDVGVRVQGESSQPDETYYLRVGPFEEVDGFSDEEIQAADLAFFTEEARLLDMTLEEYLDLRFDKGTSFLTLGTLAPNTQYCVYGYGMRNDGTVTSAITRKPFRTLGDGELQIAVAVDEVGTEAATVTFTPKSDEFEYAGIVRPSEKFLSMSDEECIAALLSETISEERIFRGEASHTFDGLTPDTEYVVFAFGYDKTSQQAITSLTRQLFKSAAEELDSFTVQIDVTDITPESANVSFIPSDKGAMYFYSVEKKARYKDMTDDELIEKALQDARKSAMLDLYLASGDKEFRQQLDHDQEYVAFAFGYDYASDKVTTGLFKREFTAGHLDVPEFNIGITVSDLTSDTAYVKFSATDEQTRYFFYVTEAEGFRGLDDDAMIEKVLDIPGYAGVFIESGEYGSTWELNPGTEYLAIAFGYEDDIPTTAPFTHYFSTPAWEDPTRQFKVSHTALTSTSVDIKIIPADKEMEYFSDLQPSADFEGLGEEEIAAKLLDEAWYVYTDSGIQDFPYTGLQPATEYTLFVFGYDSSGETRTTPVTSYKIHTLPE